MNIFEAAGVVVIPLLLVWVPGAFFIQVTSSRELLPKGARIILWSMVINTIGCMLGLMLGIGVEYSFGVIIVTSLIVAALHKQLLRGRTSVMITLFGTVLFLLVAMAYIVPFLRIHDGLPTGDVQKTIIWAQQSVQTHRLPNYAESFTLLNRDPVDFYTPGLHSLSALVLRLSPAPLVSIGIFSIFAAIAVAYIAAAITRELFSSRKYTYLPLLTALLVLTEFRFLRYLREPGYHYQNIFGELYLFGILLLFLSFMRRRRMQDAILFFLLGITLFFSHQFSAFIAVWALMFGVLALAIVYSHAIVRVVKAHVAISVATVAAICSAGTIAILLGLIKKLPSLFTLHPHLAGFLPAITDYPTTMGAIWFMAGILGIAVLVLDARQYGNRRAEIIAFVVFSLAILALSQGPAIGVDIPPVRALFYSVVPLSLAGAYFFYRISARHKALFACIVLVVCIASYSSVQRAYASLSHEVRTNSTLTGQQESMIAALAQDTKQGGVLIDDYNRRAASWLALSGHPMMTRISADLQTQMNEASQSQVRHDLYINQLDYEKIFALGSMPSIVHLMQKHSLQWVTGVASSSEFAFAHNPLLQRYGIFDDATLFVINNHILPACDEQSMCEFLLRSTTIANDIGDDEDTFEHLEVSLRTPRLSAPEAVGNTTYRETTSPYIPIECNVADYVQALWDPQRTGKPAQSLTFMLSLTSPVDSLELQTSSGAHIPLKQTLVNTVILTPDMLTIDDRGFITLTIANPKQQRIGIDLIALGV